MSELDVSFLRNIGCCDNSCHFIKTTGAGTNGGCRCLKDLSGGRSMNHALLVLGPILKQIPDEIDRLKDRNEKLEAIREAVEKYETHLPTTEPVGAARFSGMLVAAMNLRLALSKLKEHA